MDADYAPDTIEDPNFNGLAVGCTEVCRVHKLLPQRCVAFGGSDTGRRFHMCSVPNVSSYLAPTVSVNFFRCITIYSKYIVRCQ